MPTKQRTIRKERSIKGKSLHTGEEVSLTLKPAEANEGYVFRRVDLYGKPEIKPLVSNVSDLVRSTTITNGNAKVHTIEHVLSALSGCGIDNAKASGITLLGCLGPCIFAAILFAPRLRKPAILRRAQYDGKRIVGRLSHGRHRQPRCRGSDEISSIHLSGGRCDGSCALKSPRLCQ